MKDQKKATAGTTTPDQGRKPLVLGLIGLGVICAFAIGILAGQKMAKPQASAATAQVSPASIESIKNAVLEANGKQLESGISQVKEIAFSQRLSMDAGLPLLFFDLTNAGALPSKGPADAPVTLVEFSDFQCPYCSKMAFALDQAMAQNPGKIRLIFVDRPLTSIHPLAMLAHEAAAVAGAQGKFWEMYDYIFKNQKELFYSQPAPTEDVLRNNLIAAAGTLGLDAAKFKIELESHTHKPRLDRSIAIADALRINSTPTVMTQGFFKLQDPSMLNRLVSVVQKIE